MFNAEVATLRAAGIAIEQPRWAVDWSSVERSLGQVKHSALLRPLWSGTFEVGRVVVAHADGTATDLTFAWLGSRHSVEVREIPLVVRVPTRPEIRG